MSRTLYRLLLPCLLLATGCAQSIATANLPSTTMLDGLQGLAAGKVPKLPAPGGSGALAPWGGSNASRWRPEAILANATSEALNTAWGMAGTRDAIVAVPLKMYASDFHPYGDGQANAVPAFGDWKESRPPLVGTLVHSTSGPSKLLLKLDRALGNITGALTLRYGKREVSVTAKRNEAGDWIATWEVPDELGWKSSISASTLFVRPAAWEDWFPLWFRMPTRPIAELEATVPAKLRKYRDGGGIVDHEGVSMQKLKQSKRRVLHAEDTSARTMSAATFAEVYSSEVTPFQALLRHDFGSFYNQAPYEPQDIHARFPYGNKQIVTAVGRGWTWVATPETGAPFKILYTGFERRRPELEASAPDGGVPSGGGWHLIGDPAETILNSLEDQPLVVGSASNNVVPSAPSGKLAYGYADVATVRWLHPGEAFVTRRGDAKHANYHWFYFQQGREVVTEEWVHPNVPNDQFDF